MAHGRNRRTFLQTTAALGMGYWVAGGVQAKESNSPNERIRMASIGVDGKGQSDSSDAGHHGEMVAICDVDEKQAQRPRQRLSPRRRSSPISARCWKRWTSGSTR